MAKLAGKIAVITGGNSGIGLASAKLFAAEGAQVIITGRRKDAVEQAAAEVGQGALAVIGDVSISTTSTASMRRSDSGSATWTSSSPMLA
jgi:NAD(P)-dependent dehydrogenase (short-subunit alcohol dehydrogenase family)